MPPSPEDPLPLAWAERDRKKEKKTGFITKEIFWFRMYTHRQKHPDTHTHTGSASWQAVSVVF